MLYLRVVGGEVTVGKQMSLVTTDLLASKVKSQEAKGDSPSEFSTGQILLLYSKLVG